MPSYTEPRFLSPDTIGMFTASRRRRRPSKHRRKRRKTRQAPVKQLRRQRGGSGDTIPKVCIQTAKKPIDAYITTQLKQYLHGWTYIFFTDEDIMKFFDEHPHKEYPGIKDKFNSFTHGEHKADLFRYYYLFMKGGVFIDSDLMLYEDLDTILGTKKFVSVRALQPVGSVFNGFLAATPQHPILLDALNDVYRIEDSALTGFYHILVAKLGTFVDAHMDSSVKLLSEITNTGASCNIKDPDSGKISMIHYQNSVIPDVPLNSGPRTAKIA
jgi:mannosyltransferase OCH1-like enzyme